MTVSLAKSTMGDIMGGATTFMAEVESGAIVLDGDPAALLTVFGNLEVFESGFAIVEP